jgi:branched-chain amino acid transport system substrate-binding protein
MRLVGKRRASHTGSTRTASRALALALPVIVIAVLLAGCGGSSSTASGSGGSTSASGANTLKIGISVPLSGPVGSSCGPMDQGELAYFNHVNATGGVHGDKLDVINKDDAYEAAEAVTNTRGFIADKVVAVTGQCGSIQIPAQAPLLSAAKIPFLFSFGSCDPCESGYGYFNLMPDYGVQLANEVPYVFKTHGAGSAVIFTSATPGAATVTSNISDAVKKAGGTVAGTYSTPPGTTDMTPYVLKMAALHPAYVILNMTPQDAAVLTKAMTSQGFAPSKYLLGDAAIAQAAFLSNLGSSLQAKSIFVSDVNAPSAEATSICGTVLKHAHVALSSVTLRGCGAAQVLTAAMEQTKAPVTSAGIVSTLESWKGKAASSVYPPLTFSSSQRIGVTKLFVLGVKNGQFVKTGQLG